MKNDAPDSIKENYPKYDSKFCQMLVDHMSKGLSLATFGHKCGVARSTMYEWINHIPEFADAKEKASQLAQEFFESRLSAKISGQEIKGIDTKKIDTACLIFALKTRFHETYGDKQHVDNVTEIKLSYKKE